MVRVTRFDGSQLFVNADMIEFIEATPDTVLSLSTNRKILVREPADAIVEQVIAYQRRVHGGPTITASPLPLPAHS